MRSGLRFALRFLYEWPSGGTALHGAAFKGNQAVVDMLLKANADPNAFNVPGKTAAKLAKLFGHALCWPIG